MSDAEIAQKISEISRKIRDYCPPSYVFRCPCCFYEIEISGGIYDGLEHDKGTSLHDYCQRCGTELIVWVEEGAIRVRRFLSTEMALTSKEIYEIKQAMERVSIGMNEAGQAFSKLEPLTQEWGLAIARAFCVPAEKLSEVMKEA